MVPTCSKAMASCIFIKSSSTKSLRLFVLTHGNSSDDFIRSGNSWDSLIPSENSLDGLIPSENSSYGLIPREILGIV